MRQLKKGINGRATISVALVATVLLAVPACGQSNTNDVVAAGQREDPSPPPIDKKKTPPRADDVDLPPDERAAKNTAEIDDFHKRFNEWVQSDAVQSLDPRTLPQEEILASYEDGYEKLEDAVDHADAAVLGTVESLKFVGYQTVTKIRVDRSAKGPAEEVITVIQQSGVRQGVSGIDSPDAVDEAKLGVSPAAPFLFKGDRVILLLEQIPKETVSAESEKMAGTAGVFLIQSFSGTYRSENGQIKTEPLNPVSDAKGVDENLLMDRIEAHVKASDSANRTEGGN